MRVVVLPSAKRDLEDAFDFYESQEAGIGTYFSDCLAADLRVLQIHAGIHRRFGALYRYAAKKFPYWIYYRLDEQRQTAFVMAVLDARRNPETIRLREVQESRRRLG